MNARTYNTFVSYTKKSLLSINVLVKNPENYALFSNIFHNSSDNPRNKKTAHSRKRVHCFIKKLFKFV